MLRGTTLSIQNDTKAEVLRALLQEENLGGVKGKKLGETGD